MKRNRLIVYFLILSIVLLYLYLFLNFSNKDASSVSGHATYSPPTNVLNCSNESIKAVWDSIFEFNSNSLLINKSGTDSICIGFQAYKNISTELYYLVRIYPLLFSGDIIVAVKMNLTKEGMNAFLLNPSSSFDDIALSVKRNITSVQEANTEFDSTFKIRPGQWIKNTTNGVEIYQFTNESENDTSVEMKVGQIAVNYSYDSFIYTLLINPFELDCTPSWKQVNTSCTSNDIFISWYNDTNSCRISPGSDYANRTFDCDHDGDGVIGNSSSLSLTNLNIVLYINGTENFTNQNFTNNTHIVELKEGNTVRVSFYHNFTERLYLKNIGLKRQSSSGKFGYLIVSGINRNKTIIIDKKNSSSNKACIVDSSISDIDSISRDCADSGEVLIECPGGKSGYYCNVSDNKFTISGLMHSAGMELPPAHIQINCTQNWSCTNWTECTLGIQRRVCRELNNCTSNRTRVESINCTLPPVCISNWSCTNWTTCFKNETKTRSCYDVRNCSVIQDKPAESEICDYSNKTSTRTIILVFIILIILIALGIVAYFLVKSMNDANSISIDNDTYKVYTGKNN